MKTTESSCRLVMNAVFAVVLLSSAVAGAEEEAETGSWRDQGDGTYRNLILNADYPDVDVEQLGDMYYMISSIDITV